MVSLDAVFVVSLVVLYQSAAFVNGFLHTPNAMLKRSTAYRRQPLEFESLLVLTETSVDCTEQHLCSNKVEIERATHTHGMPWRTSMSRADDANLFYIPFWERQLRFMKENLTNLKVVECTSKGSTQFPLMDKKFDYKESEETTSRIVSLCFSSDEYRKIRMTYYENGQVGQSLNSVWYPDAKHNVPILGVNLLSKSNINKHLAIIDFQPLYKEEQKHSCTYSHLQKDILKRYPELSPDPTDRINKLQVFSPHMVCKRFQKEEMVKTCVFPAFCDYIQAHVDMVQSTTPEPTLKPQVMKRHVAFDTYSSVRDPCTPLLGSLFGKQWAEEFVYGFLYSLSERKEEDYWETNNNEDADCN